MGGLEHRSGNADIGPRRHAEPSHLGGKGIRDEVADEIRDSEHAVLGGAQEHLLEHGIRDPVVHEDLSFGQLPVIGLPQIVFGHRHMGELVLRELVSPVSECALGELHDIALVHQGDDLLSVGKGILYGHLHQSPGAGYGYGLDADARVFPDGRFHGPVEEFDDPARLGRALAPLDAGVDVLGVFPENSDVYEFGPLHRGGGALVVSHRPHAGEQIEHLSQGHVQRPDASAYGGRERALDAHDIFTQGIHRLVRQPAARGVVCLLPRQNLFPHNASAAAVRLFHGLIEHVPGRLPDIRPCAVAFDEGNDGFMGNMEPAV